MKMDVVNQDFLFSNIDHEGISEERRKSLLIRIPGGSGHGWPVKKKYFSETAYFWLHGFNSYLFTLPGVDGLAGESCPGNSIDLLNRTIARFRDEFGYDSFYIVSTCIGGMFGAYASLEFSENVNGLIIYDTPLEYTESDWEFYIEKNKGTVNFADFALKKDDFLDYNLSRIIDRVNIPILYAYGDEFQKLTKDGVAKMKTMPNVDLHYIPGGQHSLGKKDMSNLTGFLSYAVKWLDNLM